MDHLTKLENNRIYINREATNRFQKIAGNIKGTSVVALGIIA
jgi:hypothetical protein